MLGAVALCGLVLMSAPVFAQFGGRGGGMFDFFGPFSGPRYAPSERPADFTRAPPARKLDNQPDGSVIVFGDSMADWLAYGLEDALGDTPDLAVMRKVRATAGLIRYDSRNESQDWAQVIREAVAQTKPKIVVMMVGLNDRQSMRERPIQAGPPGSSSAGANPPPLVPQPGVAPRLGADAADTEQPPAARSAADAAPQQKPAGGLVTYEFRTEDWAEHYARRIDHTIAALKSAGVPVFWVGLPSVRGPKSTAEMLYLNDLFRSRAEKAGVSYIDVWDGFVDESGRFAVQGPDFEGQIRRLRVSDGVHFTKAGARKLAHYLEREMRRVTTRGLDLVALPPEPQMQPSATDRPGSPMARPLSGPVLQLTGSSGATQDLLGGSDATAASAPRVVTRVLVKGEAIAAPAGRSDDFKWPRRGVAAFGTDPVVATTTDPVPVVAPPPPAVAAAPAVDNTAKPAASRKTTGHGQQSPRARTSQSQQRASQQRQQREQRPARDNFFQFGQ